MKAYVIKVGNRGYISKYKNYNYNLQNPSQMCLTNKIENAKLFTGSLTFMLSEYKLVPITICEGDLEEENRVLKKALEFVCSGYVEPSVYGTDIWEQAEKCGGLEQYFIQQEKEKKDDI